MRTVLIFAMILLLFSCSSDDEQTRSNNGVDYYTVHIVLSTGGNGFTRATPDHNNGNVQADEQGTPAENYINPDDVTLLVYKKDGNKELIERAILHKVTPRDGETGIYDVEGVLWKIPLEYKDVASQEFQLIALCNINGMLKSNFSTMAESDYDTLDELVANLTFDYDTGFTQALLTQANETDDSKRTARIPMFGGKIANLIPPSGSNTVTPTIEIDVLRALAKIEVAYDMAQDNPLYGDFYLHRVTLANYRTRGSVAANDPLNSDGTTKRNSKDANKTEITAAKVAGDNAESLVFQQVKKNLDANGNYQAASDGERTDRHIVFVPEFDNMSNAANPQAYMKLRFRTDNYGGSGDGGGVDGWPEDQTIIYFADYSGKEYKEINGNSWDIIRNDIYRYTITSISESGTMNIVANVPWVVEESTLGWDLDKYATFTTTDAEGQYCFMLNPRYESSSNGGHNALMNASSFAEFKFKLTAPEGAIWRVHLSNTYFFALSGGVFTARASDKTYAFNIRTNYAWTEENDPETGVPYPPEEFDRALTEWGKIWEVTGGPETDIYITVTTDGVNEREVVINPPGKDGKYKDGRLWPGTDTRVRMKQLRAKYGESYYEWGDQYKQ